MSALSEVSGQSRASSRPGLLTAAIAVVSVEGLMDTIGTVLRLSGKPIPIWVVVMGLIAAAVLAVAVVDLIGGRKRGQTLAVVASTVSAVPGIIGVFVAPTGGTKAGNAVLALVGVTAIVLLTRPATKNALT